uniref:Glycosyltransferase n=1 Tax=Ignisphaera aggregans TaxID=334771 RepID=A0A7J3YU25_9CREN
MNTSLIIVTKGPVDIKNYISGQEFFLYMLVKVLPRYGIDVKIIDVDELIESREYYTCNLMHLYYLGFKNILTLKKLYKNIKMIYHVYHVEDVSWTRTHEFSWKAFLLGIQPLIYAYLATSKSVYSWLKSRVFLARSILVEPYYECSCRVFHSHSYINMVHEKFHDHEIRLLYVGRLNPYRSPPHMLLEIAKGVSKKTKRSVRLVIVTKSGRFPDTMMLKYNNLTVNLINRRIDDREKCDLYRKSQFFIYLTPRGNVAMNPPITILEAVYHGVIPIVSEILSKDVEVPNVLMANSLEEAVNKITLLYTSLSKKEEALHSIIASLRKAFKGFYDEDRFINAFKCLT